MKAFLCLGTIDEVVGILPIVQNYESNGVPAPLAACLIVREVFLDVLKPTHVWMIGWDKDFTGALLYAKQNFSEVVTFPSRHDATVEHRHPSHQFDQWDRAGVLHLWRKLPLTLPRVEDSDKFVRGFVGDPFKGRRSAYILLCDEDSERPFSFRDELYKSLVEEFPSHNVIRMTLEIPTITIPQLLALYDAADLIVCAETVHLQLTRATKTPVLAIANDQPTPWHGSAPHPRFKWYGHYSSFGVPVGDRVLGKATSELLA